jgi:hypothetical protein
MKSRTALVMVVLVALIVAGAALVYAQSGPPGAGRDPHSLAGSWAVNGLPDPGAPIPPFAIYTAYEQDGVTIATTSNLTQLIGTWTRTGGNRFASTYMGFEPFGEETLRVKVREAIELSQDGNAFSGSYVTEVFLDGNLLARITGTMQGTRMQVEPLD